ncbi:hypothetical protein GQ600_27815 [Phytophthora cactorum]|nr:hypothetical protein GQ600_27815 [Phytophthora cactorum]
MACYLSSLTAGGVHERETEPLFVRGAIADSVDKKLVYETKGSYVSVQWAIVWEQHRPAKMLCLSRYQPIVGLSNALAYEFCGDGWHGRWQYGRRVPAILYMTKEKGGLKFATTAMHTAISDILEY